MVNAAPVLSVIIPCRNEVRTIRHVLDDLQAQDFLEPFEVVVADGCSDDGTVALLADAASQGGYRFALRIIDNPDLAIPHALNRAVAASQGTMIIRVDGHCRVDPDYLSTLVAALRSGGDVVGPQIQQIPGAETRTARTIALLLGTTIGTGGTPSRGRLNVRRQVEHTVMSCYHRVVWERIGGYDESLLSNEDFDFDYRAHAAGFRVFSLPKPVFKLVARSSLGGLVRQRWRYGWWKAAVLRKHPASLRLRQMLPLLALVGLLSSLAYPVVALLGILGYAGLAALVGFLTALRSGSGWASALTTGILSVSVLAIIHFVWSAGVLTGLLGNRLPRKVHEPAPIRVGDHPRVAIIHDWIEVTGGSEQVLFELLECFPTADLHAVVDFRDEEGARRLAGRRVRSTFIQQLPWSRRCFRCYLPFMPLAIEQLDLQSYDLVISSSHAVAKGVLTGPGQVHVCYCHSPLRYVWDQQGAYLSNGVFGRGLLGLPARFILHYLRMWDQSSSARVDHFLANSAFVAARIAKYYRRESLVVPPPVPVHEFPHGLPRGAHYLTVSRLVAYKRIDVLIEAFRRMPDRQLLIVGDGPERDRLAALAPSNVKILGHLPTHEVRQHLATARAFCFAGEEDFGIVTVEAQACGTPVIAYGRGGSVDIVQPGVTGVLVPRQDPAAFVDAIKSFEQMSSSFDHAVIRSSAERFSQAAFRERLFAFLARVQATPVSISVPPS